MNYFRRFFCNSFNSHSCLFFVSVWLSQVPICRISSFLKRVECLFTWILTSLDVEFWIWGVWKASRWDLLRNATKSSSERAQWSTRHGWAQWLEMRKEHHTCGLRKRKWERVGEWNGEGEKKRKGAAKRAVTIAASITRSNAHGLFQYYAPWQVSQTARRSTYSGSIWFDNWILRFGWKSSFSATRDRKKALSPEVKKISMEMRLVCN